MADAQPYKNAIIEAIKEYAEGWERLSLAMGEKMAAAIAEAQAEGIEIRTESFTDEERVSLAAPISQAQKRLEDAFKALEKKHGIKGDENGGYEVL